ncbi:MAG: formate--tetrahydrofolate ligase, partial [Gemmatimonadota bacterium]|nr:formate--tetrahydrofolate ligase [Gemmatimonadota bacterium]
LDNHLHHGNALGIDPRKITWPRTMDMNDRALRDIVVGLGGINGGVPRQDRFVITPASEIMAIMALSSSAADLEDRLGRIIVGATRDKQAVRAADLKAEGSMALLLHDALQPNLVQTLEGGPAFVHCGPFGNIAHGCNSIIATDTALKLADLVITEAGFGADLGAQKFFDIKCRAGDLAPDAVIIVATVRALKLNGGANKTDLATANPKVVESGFPNLRQHIENLQQYGIPVIVALNRFVTDSAAELAVIRNGCAALGVDVALTEVWEKGGQGGVALAELLGGTLASSTGAFKQLYDVRRPIREKIETIATKIYRADGVDFLPPAERALKQLPEFGLGETPVCIAKTQYSFSDNPALLAAPRGFRITIRDIYPSAGAGFVVALAGDVMTMPGLGKSPAAERIRLHPDGTIEGLF